MKNLLFFLFSFFILFNACQKPFNPAIIEGHWQSTTDKLYKIKIGKGQFIQVHDKELVAAGGYTFKEKCPEGCANASDKPCLVTEGEEGNFCYMVLKADAENLELVYTEGTGQPLIFKKTAAFEIPPKRNPYLISDNSFMGINLGDDFSAHADKLEKTIHEDGEGTFEAYALKGGFGLAFPDPNDATKIGQIHITSEKAVTENGISVGMAFAELDKKIEGLEVNGSEIEGRTYAHKGNYNFLLDDHHWSYEIKKEEIKKDAVVIAIEIRN